MKMKIIDHLEFWNVYINKIIRHKFYDCWLLITNDGIIIGGNDIYRTVLDKELINYLTNKF
jgi:hypothetical protein